MTRPGTALAAYPSARPTRPGTPTQAQPIAPVRRQIADTANQNPTPRPGPKPTNPTMAPAMTPPATQAGTQTVMQVSPTQACRCLAQSAKTSGTSPAATPGSTALFALRPYQSNATPDAKRTEPNSNVKPYRRPRSAD